MEEKESLKMSDDEKKILDGLVGEKFLKAVCTGRSSCANIMFVTPSGRFLIYFKEIECDIYDSYDRIAIIKYDKELPGQVKKYYFTSVTGYTIITGETDDGELYDRGLEIRTEQQTISICVDDYAAMRINHRDLEPFKTKPTGWCEGFREEKKRIGNKNRESTE